jgi:type II secretory pathway component PulC
MTDTASAGNRIRLMSPVTFYRKWLLPVGWCVFLVAILVGVAMLVSISKLPEVIPDSRGDSGLEWLTPADTSDTDWKMFHKSGESPRAGRANDLANRFRLAGTFFEFTAMGSRSRQAILDDRVQGRQHIVREREKIDDIEIVEISRDHVVLKDQNGEEVQLWLSLSGRAAAVEGGARGVDTARERAGSDKSDRFGSRRTGEHSWVFDRGRLMEYYAGMRDEAERLVLLFDSLKPVYTPEGWIRGYRLGVEGEADFFASAGLNAGDIVRSVNGVEMSNRRRAEYFFEQVVMNEATALVLAVQRDGVTNKFTYQIR